MSDADKEKLIVKDPPWSNNYAIESYPIAVTAGQEVLRGSEVIGTIREAIVFHRESDLLAYCEAQKPKPMPVASVCLNPTTA